MCNVCGTNLVQRPDDRLETVETRLSVYREET
ncbi:MAG: adenylate kinase, partial [Firmicutes bacterium]|nr:adenylate kinase [Bacillota bacterium]